MKRRVSPVNDPIGKTGGPARRTAVDAREEENEHLWEQIASLCEDLRIALGVIERGEQMQRPLLRVLKHSLAEAEERLTHRPKRAVHFRPQQITIQTEQGPASVAAMVGEGSGLAYYEYAGGYRVISMRTGKAVCDVDAMANIFTRRQAREPAIIERFIAEIAGLASWTLDEDMLKAQVLWKYGSEQAFGRCLHETFDRVCELCADPGKTQGHDTQGEGAPL
jgi:hypothetical protein